MIPIQSWYVNLKSPEYCNSLRTDFPMRKDSGQTDCDAESPLREKARLKVCSKDQADLDPLYIELQDNQTFRKKSESKPKLTAFT